MQQAYVGTKMDFSITVFNKNSQQKHKTLKGRFAGVAGLIFITLTAMNHALADSSNSGLVPSSPALSQSPVLPTGQTSSNSGLVPSSPALPQSPVLPTSQTSAYSTSCTVPHAGAPSCEAESNAGSSAIAPDIPYHVGNPIDVISGNKYQRDIDYKAFNSGLTLVRHYNSSLADHDTGFGQGWRHTYQVFLTRPEPGKLNIVQSDGRLIEFSQLEGTQAPKVYIPHNRSDGVLIAAEKSVWHLPDGRTFTFNGSYLTEIDFGDHRGSLTLHYQQRRVNTVTDSRGGVLKFVYTSRQSSLPRFGSDDVLKPVGSIESVVMPNGDTIRYEYGRNNNLVLADYPDGDNVAYRYEDPSWLNHLTARQSSLEERNSEWAYDDNGYAVSWFDKHASGVNGNGLHIDRSNNEASDDKIAQVIYSDGRVESYQWIERQHDEATDQLNVDISCQNCPDYRSHTNTPPHKMPTDTAANQAATELELTNTIDQSVALSVATTLQRTATANRLSGQDSFEGALIDDTKSTPLLVTADRLGKLSDLQIGNTSLSDMAGQLLSNELQPCKPGEMTGATDEITRSRIHALGSGQDPCAEDPFVMLDFADQLEQSQQGGESTFQLQQRSTNGFLDTAQRFATGTLRYCNMPDGRTCEEVTDDLRMAELSLCAYGNHSCEPRFQLVDPTTLGLSQTRFSDNGFDAQLYFDPVEQRHILAFRGTDDDDPRNPQIDNDDWETNFAQARGQYARQYDLAQGLAQDLYRNAHVYNLTFTGHSLGGGLATIAALVTQRQANIFNAAALQPQTATNYGRDIEYANSDLYINHVHTRSDPLTRVQNLADDIDYSPTSRDPNGNTIIHADIQSVHGNNTQIPNPDLPWVFNQTANASTIVHRLGPVIYHSIDAVIHTLENLVSANCPQQSTIP